MDFIKLSPSVRELAQELKAEGFDVMDAGDTFASGFPYRRVVCHVPVGQAENEKARLKAFVQLRADSASWAVHLDEIPALKMGRAGRESVRVLSLLERK